MLFGDDSTLHVHCLDWKLLLMPFNLTFLKALQPSLEHSLKKLLRPWLLLTTNPSSLLSAILHPRLSALRSKLTPGLM